MTDTRRKSWWRRSWLLPSKALVSIALLTVVLQVWPWLRKNHWMAHRWISRVYRIFPVLLAAHPVQLIPRRKGVYRGLTQLIQHSREPR